MYPCGIKAVMDISSIIITKRLKVLRELVRQWFVDFILNIDLYKRHQIDKRREEFTPNETRQTDRQTGKTA